MPDICGTGEILLTHHYLCGASNPEGQRHQNGIRPDYSCRATRVGDGSLSCNFPPDAKHP
jgi:hypothetical protein